MEGEGLLGHVSADASRVYQPVIIIIIMEAQQKGAQKRGRPFRVRPAEEAFEAVSIGGAAEGPRRRRPHGR